MADMPATINELVRDRIQKDFVSLIPVENWTQLVNGVVQQFTTKKKRGQYQEERYTSDLEELILADIAARAKELIKAELNKSEYQSMWDGMGQQVASATVQEICEKYGHTIFNKVIANMVSNVMLNLQKYGV
jgi:hypothetical protein